MSLGNRISALPSVLTRAQWATALVLAGTGLLVFPPEQSGPILVGWVLGVLVAAVVVVVVAVRVLARLRT